jgi:hypothetical protein
MEKADSAGRFAVRDTRIGPVRFPGRKTAAVRSSRWRRTLRLSEGVRKTAPLPFSTGHRLLPDVFCIDACILILHTENDYTATA